MDSDSVKQLVKNFLQTVKYFLQLIKKSLQGKMIV